MNGGFTYPYWFQKGNDGTDYWAFTTSGDPDDPDNYNVSELEVLLRWASGGSPYSEWIQSIIGIGVSDDLDMVDFHFQDGSVSVSTAYLNESHEFLDALELFVKGYIVSLDLPTIKPAI